MLDLTKKYDISCYTDEYILSSRNIGHIVLKMRYMTQMLVQFLVNSALGKHVCNDIKEILNKKEAYDGLLCF